MCLIPVEERGSAQKSSKDDPSRTRNCPTALYLWNRVHARQHFEGVGPKSNRISGGCLDSGYPPGLSVFYRRGKVGGGKVCFNSILLQESYQRGPNSARNPGYPVYKYLPGTRFDFGSTAKNSAGYPVPNYFKLRSRVMYILFSRRSIAFNAKFLSESNGRTGEYLRSPVAALSTAHEYTYGMMSNCWLLFRPLASCTVAVGLAASREATRVLRKRDRL